MKYLGYSELTKRLYVLPASAKAPKIDITEDVNEFMKFKKQDIESILEEKRKSYNKGISDGHKQIAESQTPSPTGDRDRIEELENGIKNFIEWLKEKRPTITGTGAPKLILESLLEGRETFATPSPTGDRDCEELKKEVERLKGENEKLWEALIRNMPKEKLDLIKNALNNL